MNSGVTSITALMTKSDLKGDLYIQQHGEMAYVKLVAAYSLYIGVASIVLALAGFGKLARAVPGSVRKGFKWGCSTGVLVSACPNGLFMNGGTELKNLVGTLPAIASFIEIWKSTLPGAASIASLIVALLNPWSWGVESASMFFGGILFVMYGGKLILPKFLPPGTDVILLTAFVTWYSVTFNYEGSIVGDIPVLDGEAGARLLGVRVPVELLDATELIKGVPLVQQFGNSYILLALSSTVFAGVNFLSLMGIAGTFEAENGIAWSAERELMAQGLSCGVAALVGSAPVSGSLSRSLVARMTGATSQLACIITALVWICMQPYMSIMSHTPKAALSAIIASAVVRGVCLPDDLLSLKGDDILIGWGTGVATAATSPTQGFGAGLALYLLVTISRRAKKAKSE